MNMSVTHFLQAPAIAARSRSVWHEIIGTVIEDRERLRTKSTSILHSISTIYHRCCGPSLSGVTSAYKRGQNPFGDARDRLGSKGQSTVLRPEPADLYCPPCRRCLYAPIHAWRAERAIL